MGKENTEKGRKAQEEQDDQEKGIKERDELKGRERRCKGNEKTDKNIP